MESRTKRTQRDYTMAFKLAVVEQVEKAASAAGQGQREGSAVRGCARRVQEGLRGARRKKAFGQVLAQKLVQGLSVGRACRYMGMSRQAFYQACARSAQRDERAQAVVQLVEQQRIRQPRLDTRKLHHLLREPLALAGHALGRDAMFDVLRNARLLVPSRRAYHKITDSHHRFRRHPNLVKAGPQQLCVTGSEQLWVADITYLPTAGKYAYLSLVTDAYSRKIVGWHVHESLQTEEAAQALKMALRGRQTQQPLVHHSDRGILKIELLLQRRANLQQARRMEGELTQICNEERPHLSLKMRTPHAVHRAFMAG